MCNLFYISDLFLSRYCEVFITFLWILHFFVFSLSQNIPQNKNYIRKKSSGCHGHSTSEIIMQSKITTLCLHAEALMDHT